MMKLLTSIILLVLAPAAFATDSLIRVDCMEGTAGAEVSINGKYQFTCSDFQKEPISLQVGNYTVTAVKNLSEQYEQVFTQKISLEAGTPQRIRVVLPEKTLTAYGQAEEARKQKQARLAAEAEKKRKLIEAVKQDMADATAGKPEAMQRLAERYRVGDGVPQDIEQTRLWLQRYKVAGEQQARAKKIADLKQQLENTSYFQGTKEFGGDLVNAAKNGSPLQMTIAPTATFVVLPICTLMDVTSMPSVTSDRNKIQDELDKLETHAARWANPDSMVAQAYGAQHTAD